MNAQSRYCSNCGNLLSAAAKYCCMCGKPIRNKRVVEISSPVSGCISSAVAEVGSPPVGDIPTDAAEPSLTAREIILGVLPGATRRFGWMGRNKENLVIVLTNYRILQAVQTDQMIQEYIQRARGKALEEGKKYFEQWEAQLAVHSGKQYLDMSPEQILNEQPENCAIPVNQIRSIRVHQGRAAKASSGTCTLELVLPGCRRKYSLAAANLRSTKNQLKELYGSIVRE